ncbi:hypothetical protein F4802DRAFT_597603 [Xylaria palmicola]|nr:hypothetical protein F4802DRAFT_597603 [Xylaria palmicola]
MCMKAKCSECGMAQPRPALLSSPHPERIANSDAIQGSLDGGTTWMGCGRHIPAALASVPADELCTCGPKVEVDGKEYPPRAK